MEFTEEQLKRFAAPLSETENDKCKNAIREIRDALKQLGYNSSTDDINPLEYDTYAYSTTLRKPNTQEEIQIFIQGSYANNTCVKGESDVDIAVIRKDKYETAFGEEFTPYTFLFEGKSEAKLFKDDVERALRSKFLYSVWRKNKSIKVDGNTYRKQADTVPCFGMKYYNKQGNYFDYIEGVTIYADNGEIINNFPKQHIANGKAKNVRTNRYYKKMVRIMKKMRYLMEENNIASASQVSSFGLESLLWNLPDNLFTSYINYRFVFEEIVKYLKVNKNALPEYKEANGIKKLCPDLQSLLSYRKFIDDLDSFYKYKI